MAAGRPYHQAVVAALRGGSGKTVITLGITAACRRRGLLVQPFKKGPDYIDSAWHTAAAGRECRNLDTFMLGTDATTRSFRRHAARADFAIVEGNRGLFDGLDARGTRSTAELAKLIGAPVLLVVDCSKATRTVAASVLGCQRLDPELVIAGVILNRMAGARHERVIREALRSACGLPVFGAIPGDAPLCLPERHLGLVPPQEYAPVERLISQAAAVVEEHVDLEALMAAVQAPPPPAVAEDSPPREPKPAFRIGVVRDGAFQFYYPENIEALRGEGAEVVELSALDSRRLPALEGLYIGGGFPETHAEALEANRSFAADLRAAVEDGLPIYAECAGLMYLGKKLTWRGKTYDMAGALPLSFVMEPRPHSHGYTVVRCDRANPFFPQGTVLRGHEFHYSRPSDASCGGLETAFQVERGHGLNGQRDGALYRNVLCAYSHVHALGCPEWAGGFARATLARNRQAARLPQEKRMGAGFPRKWSVAH